MEARAVNQMLVAELLQRHEQMEARHKKEKENAGSQTSA